jgi:excisionase family DNA binding protein
MNQEGVQMNFIGDSRLQSSEVRADLLRLGEAATFLGISKSSVQNLIRAGQLRIVRIGKSVRIRQGELNRFVEAREQ